MQTVFLLALACLAASVRAGGYQGCLERVWLFQAYLIDGLNLPSDQMLGFACSENDENNKKCIGDWKPCKRKKGSGRCNFDEFVHSLRKAPKPTGWSIEDTKTGKLDVEATAESCYKMYTSQPGKKDRIQNYPAYKAMKDAPIEYNDFFYKKPFETTTNLINTAGAGDHGPYLVKEAKDKLGNKMDIKIKDLSSHPATGEKWEAVDWKETALEAKRGGVSDYHGQIKGFLVSWYRGSQKGLDHESARKHHAVMRAFKR